MESSKQSYVIALVTDSVSPALSASDQMLVAPLRELGIHTIAVPWESRETDWRAFDLVVLRSCWNYHRHLDAFRSWLNDLEASDTRLWNPAVVVRWNLDKRYLRDLADAGVSVVPTVWLDAGQPAQLVDILDAQGWPHAVIKPRISASAHGIWQTDRASAQERQSELEHMLATTGALIQPLMPQIAAGEWSLVFFDGRFSHATLKVPSPGEIFVQQRLGGTTQLRQPDARLIGQAAMAVQAAIERIHPPDSRLLYARVDGLDVERQLMLMELELIEPGLFLDRAAPDAPTRFAEAIAAVITRRC